MPNEDLKVPSFCPVCQRLMTGNRSVFTYYDHGCCRDCWVHWVDQREERWASGWRPSPEEVEKFRDWIKSQPVLRS